MNKTVDLLSKGIKKIEPIIEELTGKKVEDINGVVMPNYLYSFPDGLWLAFEFDQRDDYFNVKLGRLFSFDDVMPRVIVLESIEYYFSAINELKLETIKYEFSHTSYGIETAIEILKNNLQIMIKNYKQLKENEKTKKLILKEEVRLKSYLLADLSNSTNLELDLKERIESFTSRINKIDSNKMIKRANKRKQVNSQLFDGLVELLFGFVVIAFGLLFAWLFSLKKDISDIPFELFLAFGFFAVAILVLIIGLTIYLVKEKRK